MGSPTPWTSSFQVHLNLESTTTALREAAFVGVGEVLRKARINPEFDNVIELLDVAAFCRNPEVVEF
jgi:hypothetical protein